MARSFWLVRLLTAALGALVVPACDSRRIGAACANDGDCGAGNACVYEIAMGCVAKPTCQQKPTGPLLTPP